MKPPVASRQHPLVVHRPLSLPAGTPSVAATLADIQACYDCLRTRFSKQPGDIVLYGQSVGRCAMVTWRHSMESVSGEEAADLLLRCC